ncbi:DUF2071 domain-containing protein [Flaviaesturariibacter flavus]|uniref:DUF2071 domain-containing protein n=1 Tax=Flaviaesturariibacter flavus TaxID=2502780 RepID=A0A4R1BNK4_9BACT|nr:DUF2071 domain-containing protein [Flaviaesturariibacter flavus]TCJ19200.1 DUF2071 domain-containing protein [Flaviaesturariibacter flavus]
MPAAPVFLTAEWRNLLMANYAVDPKLLLPYLPCRTELDTYDGTCYASLVGFLFDQTRVRGIAIPGHRRFEEVNLRFYVRFREDDEWKRGVVFLREIVPRRAICWVANGLYRENYVYHPMRHSWKQEADRISVSYEWHVGGDWNYLRANAEAVGEVAAEDSPEAFITEHYWGYTTISDRCTGTYKVEHPRWRVHRVHDYSIRCDVARLYGAAFAEPLAAEPRSVFLADGSPVSVLKGERLYLAKG